MAAGGGETKQHWGDDDEDFLPPAEVIGPDSKGIKTIIEYRFNDQHEKVKVTSKIKIVKSAKRISKRALSRQQWKEKKYGASAGDPVGAHPSTTSASLEEIGIDDPKEELKNAKAEEEAMLKRLRTGLNRRQFNQQMEDQGIKMGGLRRLQPESAETDANGKYVPPNMRSGGNMPGSEDTNEVSTTLRITNLTAETTDQDVRALCSRYGRISRVFLAKDRETQMSKGFAYVSFYTRSDAEKAIEALDRAGYNHVILHVEWAKPSKREDVGSQNVMAKGFTSGYGRSLPQGITKNSSR